RSARTRSALTSSIRPPRGSSRRWSPVLRSSTTRTSRPFATSRATRCDPMNPAPPVTRSTAIADDDSGCPRSLRRRQRGEQRLRILACGILDEDVLEERPRFLRTTGRDEDLRQQRTDREPTDRLDPAAQELLGLVESLVLGIDDADELEGVLRRMHV